MRLQIHFWCEYRLKRPTPNCHRCQHGEQQDNYGFYFCIARSSSWHQPRQWSRNLSARTARCCRLANRHTRLVRYALAKTGNTIRRSSVSIFYHSKRARGRGGVWVSWFNSNLHLMWHGVSQMNLFPDIEREICYHNRYFDRFAFNIKSGNAMFISLRFFRN